MDVKASTNRPGQSRKRGHSCPEDVEARWQCAASRLSWGVLKVAKEEEFPFINPEKISYDTLERQVYDYIMKEDVTSVCSLTVCLLHMREREPPFPTKLSPPKPVRLSFPYPSVFYGDDILSYLRNVVRNLPFTAYGQPRFNDMQLERLLSIQSPDKLAVALEPYLDVEELRQLRSRLLAWNIIRLFSRG